MRWFRYLFFDFVIARMKPVMMFYQVRYARRSFKDCPALIVGSDCCLSLLL